MTKQFKTEFVLNSVVISMTTPPPSPYQAQVSEHLAPSWWHYLGRWFSPARGSMSLGMGFEDHKLILVLVFSFCFMLAFEDVSPQRSAPATMPAACCLAYHHDGLLPISNHKPLLPEEKKVRRD